MTTNFEFFDTSEKARAFEKYPWRSLPEGKSFFIDTKVYIVKLQTIQSSASRWSKKLKRRFKVVAHESGIEVARLCDGEQ